MSETVHIPLGPSADPGSDRCPTVILRWAEEQGLVERFIDADTGDFIWMPTECDLEHFAPLHTACEKPHLPKWLAGLSRRRRR